MHKKLLTTAIASLIAGQAVAIEVINDGTNKLGIGGRIDVETATSDGKTRGAKGSSRVNFAFERMLSENITGVGKAEWGYKSKNDYINEDPDPNNAAAAADRVTKAKSDLFRNRLGYVGIEHAQYGAITAGKQWSVYYDITGWTDMYAIGGGKASGTCSGFTSDGGFNGTGLADDAFIYRGEFNGLNVGAQYQLRATNYDEADSNVAPALRNNRQVGDIKRQYSYQFAVSYNFDMGLAFGATYHKASFEGQETQTESEKLNSEAVAFGIKYAMDDLYLAAVYGQFRNHTGLHNIQTFGTNDDNLGLDKKSDGIELYARYNLSMLMDGGISLEAGWNRLKVKDNNSNGDDTSSDAKIDRMMLGVIYEIGPMEFAGEYTWNKDRTFTGVVNNNIKEYRDSDNVFSLLARYYF